MSGQPFVPAAGGAQAAPAKITYSASNGFARRLADLSASLLITSYQSNVLYLIGQGEQGGLNVDHTPIAKPMGAAMNPSGGFYLASERAIEWYTNGLRADQRVNHHFDANFVPRTRHLTGRLDAHDVGVLADGTPVFVNTRFNCLATPSPMHAFKEYWRPPFISDLVDEDRCHLNGLAMRDGAPAFVSAVSQSDTIDGWRDRRARGGVLLHVADGEVVCSGLSMPHSPRWHDEQLWVLNSGSGELGHVDLAAGRFEPVCFCPGFVRGLTFAGRYAFVGLSKPRYKRFEGLDLDARLAEKDSAPWCGVQVIDLMTGQCVDWFRLDGDIAELYEVALVPGVRAPMATDASAAEAANFITVETA